MGDMILYRSGGGSSIGYPPENVTDFSLKAKSESVDLLWSDPDDITLSDGTVVKWAYTRIVRKTGSYPKNENDGAIVVQSSVRNQYQTDPYTDTGLTNGTTYYYAAFACSDDGIFNEEVVAASGTPMPYKVMTVIIDESNSNPATCCSYADDAVTMPSGKGSDAVSAWQQFFGYRPCLFKDGQVVGYLNPNDYTKFEDGTAADITSGNSGDVMVEFPRMGVRISKSGTKVTVSMTDDPDDSSFTYYAHTRGSSKCKNFYLGAYLCQNSFVSDKKIRSLSGQPIYHAWNNSTYFKAEDVITYCHALGDGYEPMTFYQWTFLQCMYLLEFKNLKVSDAIGYAWTHDYNSESYPPTGGTDQCGLVYGTTNSSTDKNLLRRKIFGIEDLASIAVNNCYGLYMKKDTNGDALIYARTDDLGNLTDESGFKLVGREVRNVVSSSKYGYITKTVGSSEYGFLPENPYSTLIGSGTTYYTCYAQMGPGGGFSEISSSEYNIVTMQTGASCQSGDGGMFRCWGGEVYKAFRVSYYK